MRTNVLDRAIVTWADGSHDTARVCSMCSSPTCFMPVHPEKYKIKIVGVLDAIEEHQEAGELESMGIVDTNRSNGDAIDNLIALEDAGEDDYAAE